MWRSDATGKWNDTIPAITRVVLAGSFVQMEDHCSRELQRDLYIPLA